MIDDSNADGRQITAEDIDDLRHILRSVKPSIAQVITELKSEDPYVPDILEMCEMVHKRIEVILENLKGLHI